jgi:hypothetical protein
MDSDSRLEVLEEELRLLKAEVKSVLLDIREAVLSRANPLRAGLPALEEERLPAADNGLSGPAEEAALPSAEEEKALTPESEPSSFSGRQEMPQSDPVQERAPEPPPLGQAMSQWSGPPLAGGDFVAWLANSMRELGPERLGHLLAMYRLLKPLPANVNLALGHLQELIASSSDPEPSWLKALVELDRLSR